MNITWNEFMTWRKQNKFSKHLVFIDTWYNYKNAVKLPFTVDFEGVWYLD